MKKLFLASIALAAFNAGNSALAADMPVKARPPVVAIYNWTGCHIGVHVGYGWRRGSTDHVDDPNPRDPFQGEGAVLPRSYDTRGRGALGGGQIGCDWQVNQFVLGIEGDLSAVRLSGSAAASAVGISGETFVGGAVPDEVTVGPGVRLTATENVSQRWLATLRARLGVAIAERLFVYATGGLAVGRVSADGSLLAQAIDTPSLLFLWSGSTSATRTGYAAGVGAEFAVAAQWTLKAEYLHYDLGRLTHPLALTANTFCAGSSCSPAFPTLGNMTTRIYGDIVRVGINYRFGGPVGGY